MVVISGEMEEMYCLNQRGLKKQNLLQGFINELTGGNTSQNERLFPETVQHSGNEWTRLGNTVISFFLNESCISRLYFSTRVMP